MNSNQLCSTLKTLCCILPMADELNVSIINKWIYDITRLFFFASYQLFITYFKNSPIGWGCRIYQLHLCIEYLYCPVSLGCRIHQLHLCQWVRPPPPKSVLENDIKQSDGETPIMLEFWGKQNTPSSPLLPGPRGSTW